MTPEQVYMVLGFPMALLFLAVVGLVHETLVQAKKDGNKALKYLYISFVLISFFCVFFMSDAVAMYFGLFRLP